MKDRRVGRTMRFRASVPEATDRQHHQRRIRLRELSERQPVTFHHPGTEVLDQHVSMLGKSLDQLWATLGSQVNADVALAHILLGVEARQPGPHLAPHPRHVALGRLHFDDVGTQVAEDPTSERSREHPAHVQHANALQWSHRHLLPMLVSAGGPRRSSHAACGGAGRGSRSAHSAERCGCPTW